MLLPIAVHIPLTSEQALKRCTCRKNQKDLCNRVVAGDVTRAIEEIEKDPRVLSVVRNGGWELWFRNLLLMRMEQTRWFGPIGFTEGANGSRRADLLFRCLHCGDVLFAAEVKTNFFSQRNDVPTRIHAARGQLKQFIEAEIPGYMIYTITHLWHEENAPYAERHNRAVQTGYKKFRNHSADVAREALADVGALLSKRLEVARCHLHVAGAHAIVRVWVARVPCDGYPLVFLNRSGGAAERKMLPT